MQRDLVVYSMTNVMRQTLDLKDVKGKRRRLKRQVRRYTRQRVGPEEEVITEEVESEYYETDSDGSVESWQLDPIGVQVNNARKQRKQIHEKYGHNPVFQTKSIMTRRETDKKFQPEKQKTTKEVLKSEMKTKRKENQDDDFIDDSSFNERRKTPFLTEYAYKLSMNRRFEDEGFWDDPATKATAGELFGLDKLDEQLYGRGVDDSERRTDGSEKDKDSEEESIKDIEDYGDSCPNKSISPAMKPASDSSVNSEDFPGKKPTSPAIKSASASSLEFTDSDAESKTKVIQCSTDHAELKKDKARVRSAIRHLLTERLFGLINGGDRSTIDGRRSSRGGGGSTRGGGRSMIVGGRSKQWYSGLDFGGSGLSMTKTNEGKSEVALVDDYNESESATKSALSSDRGLPPLSGSIPPSVAPRSTSYPHPGLRVSDQSTILADGLEKDKIFINRAQKSHIHCFKTDYNGGPERRFVKHVDTTQILVEMMPSPYHPVLIKNPNSPMTFVSRRDVNVSKAPISYTTRSRHVDVLSMDEWRLRKLLDELYKDKKYMDLLLHKEGKPSDVKQLAHYGRDYLLQIADLWESKGILPPRPDQTMADSKAPVCSKTSLSLKTESKDSKTDASRLGLDRNKTVS
ncbi:uncharacterized protein LOC121389246 [Gigantopelta aegis]|uniref:uncharacterized protein LOC121389246 n=1 Tax=Gigantopelta aegis TaxID=1735272 RepID=UPI001B88B1E3|nr:uncharacterized protein LOC121389246 [Gigantopelta aegis]